MNELEAQAWDIIRRQYRATGFAPSCRELARMLNKGSSSVHETMVKLKARGLLIYSADGKRYIPRGWRMLAVKEGEALGEAVST